MCVQLVTPPHGERTTTGDPDTCHVNVCPQRDVLVTVLLGLCWDHCLETVLSLMWGTANE